MPTISSQRIHVPLTGIFADANILRRHPGEAAAWIWHPACLIDELAVLRFFLEVEGGSEVVLHVSADQRYQLRIAGTEIGYGPDRCDLHHWSVASHRVTLPAGRHRVEAVVWFLGDRVPQAQITRRGGFLLAADGDAAATWNTGTAAWQVERLDPAMAFTHHDISSYLDVGPCFSIACAGWFAPPAAAVSAVVIEAPITNNPSGVQRRHWRLHPTILPEQRRERITGGRIRAVVDGDGDAPIRERIDGRVQAWQALLSDGTALTVPPHTSLTLLWDLGEYRCGYGDLRVSGGLGAQLRMDWAEALYEGSSAALLRREIGKYRKGQRDAIDGKVFVGFGERWTCDGGAGRDLPTLWWRAGRFVLLRITTTDQPLMVERLAVLSSRYPLDAECAFASSDPALDGTLPLLLRGLQMSAHETYVDCPYYEQLLYGGDGRLEFLAHYAVARDDRLVRRCLELFDWSRWSTGLVAERYPSRDFQVSATYAMLYPLMVRDYVWWRGDTAFARERLLGVRCLVEELQAITGADGLLGRLPGWSFIDWVPEWSGGMGPGVTTGDSSIVNLHWVLCLQAAADMEDALGDAALAQRYRRLASTVGAATAARWWDEARGLLADDASRHLYSEHAQCLALLAGIFDSARAERCLNAWLAATDLAQATIYFSFYTLEALYRAGRGDELVRRLDFWKGLQAQGFTTTVEKPEPSRSDCHGWGAHPLFHLQASIAGIRPSSPGFASVIVAPSPGPLTRICATCPHPSGAIQVRWDKADRGWTAEIELPPGLAGVWRFAGREQPLRSGLNRLSG